MTVCIEIFSVLLTVAGCVGCGARPPFRVGGDPGLDTRGPTDPVGLPVEPADSAFGLEERLLDAEPVSEEEWEAVAAQASDAAAEAEPGSIGAVPEERGAFPPWSDLPFDVHLIRGSRREVRLRVGDWHGVSGGFKRQESSLTGFVRVEGNGVIRSVHYGRLTLRAGERLILGRSLGTYAMSGSGPVRGGVAVSPSLSSWLGRKGAAVALGWARWRLQTVVLAAPEGLESLDPRWLWVSASREGGHLGVGVTAGGPLGKPVATDQSRPRPRVLMGHGSFRGPGFDGSGEVAWLTEGDVFAAVRLGRRFSPKRLRGSILVFRAPYSSLEGDDGLEPSTKTDQGVRIDGSSFIGGFRASVRLTAGRTWGPKGEAAYRRVLAGVRTRSRTPIRWEVSVYRRAELRHSYPASPILRQITSDLYRELRVRTAVEVVGGGGGNLRAAARVDYIPREGEMGSGTLLSLSTGVRSARAEVQIHLTAHSLGAGRRAFASRPGIGSFESIASLYGRGSDLSIRLRVRLNGAARFAAFYGSSWRGCERLYAGLECRR